jgi:uncharacterized protein
MKYLLVLIVVMVGIWVWRANRSGERAERRAERQAAQRARDRGGRAQVAVDIVGCDWCGLHFPRGDAIDGRKGVYCCVQHRDQAEA